MMDWTTRHCRYFMRLLSQHCVLYTEMITTGAILHGDKQQFLAFNAAEHPVVVQLGGSDPTDLAECAKICEQQGYDEINLNIGCPSPRVQRGSFGACLMKEADLVAQCVDAMQAACRIPVTIKTRIGVDEQDSYAFLQHFIQCSYDAGVRRFILHARKAWLKGLSPKENREIPPLHYEVVHRLKQDFPDCMIEINGGFKTVAAITEQLTQVDGVMIGREAYHRPYLLAELEQHVFGAETLPSRWQVMEQYQAYVSQELAKGTYLSHLVRPILGLFCGEPGARVWRRYISEHAYKKGADITVLRDAIAAIRPYYD